MHTWPIQNPMQTFQTARPPPPCSINTNILPVKIPPLLSPPPSYQYIQILCVRRNHCFAPMAADMITCSQLGSKLTRVLANNHAASLQNAWHLLSLVLASGRPNRLRELLSRCKFLRFTLYMIGSLCSLPESPFFLTPNGVVSIIQSTFVAFTQALWNLWSGLAFVPRSLRYLARRGSLANVTKVYSRKRKRNVTGIQALSAGGDMGAPGN